MRLDKYISNNSRFTRSEVEKLLHQKRVKVNHKVVTSKSMNVNNEDVIKVDGEHIQDIGFVYYVLDKPKGYISAIKDENENVVVDLVPEKYKHLNLKPVGRLDKDTTGLIILTNDDKFIHEMTSPKNKIEKTYIVTLADPIQDDYQEKLQNGITLKDGYKTKESKFMKIDENKCELTITEGKYHQVKRMFGALGNKVVELRRIKFGDYEIKR